MAVGYIFTMSGEDIRIIGTPEIIETIGQMQTFKVAIVNHQENRDLIAHRSQVYIKEDDVQIFAGVLTNIKYQGNSIIVSGFHIGLELTWPLFSKNQGQTDIRRVEYINIAANSILGDILTGTSPTWTIGSCPATQVTVRFEYATLIQAIVGLANILGYEWYLTDDRTVYIIASRGITKESIDFDIKKDKEEDSLNIVNRWRGLGSYDGISQLSAMDEDATSQGNYGLTERPFTDTKIIDSTELATRIAQLLAETKDLIETLTITVKAEDFYDLKMGVGDTIPLVNKETNIDGSYRIKNYTLRPGVVDLQVANIIKTATESIGNANSRIDNQQVYAQGATNFLVYDFNDSCDNAKDLDKEIYIPSKTKSINYVWVNFDIKPYRAYSTANANESAHTHAVTGFATDAGSAHTHNIVAQTTGAGTAHKHNLPNTNAGSNHVHTNPNTNAGSNHTHTNPNTNAGSNHVHSSAETDAETHSHTNSGNHNHGITDQLTTTESSHRHLWAVYAGSAGLYTNYKFYAEKADTSASYFNLESLGSENKYTMSGSSHLHSVTGKLTDPNDHNHTNEGSHTHTVAANTGGENAHTHSQGNTGGENAHTHSQGNTGGEAAHTHTQGDTGNESTHTHNLTGVTDNDTVHTHPITGKATGGGSAHTHGITYGISETALVTPSVGIKVDGNDRTAALGGPWAAQQTELDISAWVTTVGWHTVTLTADELMRLDGCIIAQVFVQSD